MASVAPESTNPEIQPFEPRSRAGASQRDAGLRLPSFALFVMLYLYRNNRMESLLLDLASVLMQPKLRVLSPELVVLQSLGMERWVSMGLASQFGVWANATYPFPRAFIDTLADAVLGPQSAAERYSREHMTLRLASLLASLPSDPSLKPLRDYLEQRAGVMGRLEIAEHLAEAIDQVQVYRPDWLASWAQEDFEEHRGELLPAVYRLLASHIGVQHVPARTTQLIEALEHGALAPGLLPDRVCLFGVASLPPMFIRVFDALSRHLPVHWFLLTASREYIGEEFSKRQFVSSPSRAPVTGMVAMPTNSESPQPLLMNFGRIMRDMGLLLERDCHYVDGAGMDFVEPAAVTVLSTLQADLCALRRRGQHVEAPRLPLLDGDRSLEIHACHGPRRELEVLRELLVDAFECDSSLRPEDVIVLLRDVETYAPLVEAVFSADPAQPAHVPYTLSDRTVGVSQPFAESIVTLLELAGARMSVIELSHLLGQAPILARFEIAFEQLPKLREWLRQLHVTWGVDLSDRAREGVLGQRENTLRFGLSRLLLGAACDSRDKAAWRGLLPVDVEGEDAALAGRLVECAETLFAWREQFATPRSFAEWYRLITQAAQALLGVEVSTAWQLAELLQVIGALKDQAENAGFDEAVPAGIIAAKVRQHFDQTRTSQTLLSSGVTFCRMLPMRGIPARVIAMVGLDDGCFPRAQVQSSFDAVARSPGRPGDRAVRDEDRHLFLETLLAARERLIITYRGRDARDDAVLPRSVVIEELLSVVDESFECEPDKPSDRLVIWHPLHAHDPRYFDGTDRRLFVRSTREYEAAMALLSSRAVPERGMTQALRPVSLDQVDLLTLERFWSAPAEFFYRFALGASLPGELQALDALDPTDLDPLERHFLTTDQLDSILDGAGADAALRHWTANARRPYSNLGQVLFDEQLTLAQVMCAAASSLGAAKRAQPMRVTARVRDVIVAGVLLHVHQRRLIDFSLATLTAKHRLALWVRHTLLAASGTEARSFILRRHPTHASQICIETLSPLGVDEATEYLERLLQLFRLGQRAPLAFFPQLSWDYAQRIYHGEADSVAFERAVRDYGDPLTEDEAEFRKPVGPREVLRLFGAEAPLGEDWSHRFDLPDFPSFVELAKLVFEPYLRHVESVDPIEVARWSTSTPLVSSNPGASA